MTRSARNQSTDYLIIGAGIVGLSIAHELKQRYPTARITIVDKEETLGRHGSGRNSGVIHSGIYYPPATLKAKVCAEGARELIAFHKVHGLPLRQCGKVLVTTRPEDDPQIDVLLERATLNGIAAELVDAKHLHAIEPEARTATDRAIFVPSTAVGDPVGVLQVLERQLKERGVQIHLGYGISGASDPAQTAYLTNGTQVHFGHAVTAAGLHADSVARLFGCGTRYMMLPFKGLYWKLAPHANIQFRRLIYPVPDLRVPFLGVHTTTTIDGATYFGPTAVPAFGREQYRGWSGMNLHETPRIITMLARQFIMNRDGFRRLAWQEGRRYLKPWFADAAKAIVPRIRSADLVACSKVGIRAQLLDTYQGRLVNDFLVERERHSTHVLNAISPAWTGAFPFARYLCDEHIPAL